MTFNQLVERISEHRVPQSWYSIDGSLKPNALHLRKTNIGWEYFFFSERGEQSSYRLFLSADEAFDYFWQKIEREFKAFNPDK